MPRCISGFRALFVSLVALASLSPLAGLAQSPDRPVPLARIVALAAADPAQALGEIDLVLADLGAGDARVTFDLFALKAELLEGLDRTGEAAALWQQLGRFAAGQRAALDRDPVPLYARAAALFTDLGDLRAARDVLLLLLEEQRDGGQSGAVLAATLDRLAALSQGAEAAAYIAGADAARTTTDSATRSSGEGGYREVEVFYATDRARTGAAAPSDFYGSGRGALDLGVAIVTVPDSHVPGMVEAPSIWRLEFGPNAARHLVLQSVAPLDAEGFYGRLNDRLAGANSPEAFVFVHGYNVGFDAAARRAAQMAYDMKYPGVPILYSWPSRGSTVGYMADTAVVRVSGRRLAEFLDDLVERTQMRTIHLVAHSMGNRALTDALELLALRRGVGPGDSPLFDQVLFAAPDVDAGLFADMLPTIRPLARRLTLYASQQDWALATSRHLHGDAPRAGQGGDDMLVNANIDSVDMSDLGDDMLAHNYFAADGSALADMVALFWRNAAPSQRCGLEPVAARDRSAPIWFYRVGTCANRKLVEIMSHMQREHVADPAAAAQVIARTVLDPVDIEALSPVVTRLLSQ